METLNAPIRTAPITSSFVKRNHYEIHDVRPGKSSITVVLHEPMGREGLNFRFRSLIDDHEKVVGVISPEDVLKLCTIYRPTGFDVADAAGKTIVVYYQAPSGQYDTDQADLLADSMRRLCKRLEEVCAQTTSLYRINPMTRLVEARPVS